MSLAKPCTMSLIGEKNKLLYKIHFKLASKLLTTKTSLNKDKPDKIENAASVLGKDSLFICDISYKYPFYNMRNHTSKLFYL